jgi:hypothetical protein
MDKVHKTITTQYYTPSSRPFRICSYFNSASYLIMALNCCLHLAQTLYLLKKPPHKMSTYIKKTFCKEAKNKTKAALKQNSVQ